MDNIETRILDAVDKLTDARLDLARKHAAERAAGDAWAEARRVAREQQSALDALLLEASLAGRTEDERDILNRVAR